MPDLERALKAVRQGMAVARHVQAGVVKAQEKEDRSPVTIADFAVQAVVAREIGPLVGEESASDVGPLLAPLVDAVRSVWAEATDDEVLSAVALGQAEPEADGFWTLDPIDGTKGFLRGDQYCVSLAYVRDGRPVLGVLGCPNLRPDLYYAVAGEGAFSLVEQPAKLVASELTDTLTFCESVEAAHSDHSGNQRLVDALGFAASKSVRIDSQCKYAVVARGDADAYLRLPKNDVYVEKIWDHAAGALVATEAGCVVSDVQGQPLDFSHGRRLEKNRGVVVATAELHQRLIEALVNLG